MKTSKLTKLLIILCFVLLSDCFTSKVKAQGSDLTENFTIAMYIDGWYNTRKDVNEKLILGYNNPTFITNYVKARRWSPSRNDSLEMSVLPVMAEDGFNTVLYYFPDMAYSGKNNTHIEQGFEYLIKHGINCGIKSIFDIKLSFIPDSSEHYSHTEVNEDSVKGDYLLDFSGTRSRAKPKAFHDLLQTQNLIAGFAGMQLAEEPSAIHYFSDDHNGIWCGQRMLDPPKDGCIPISCPPDAISRAIATYNTWFTQDNFSYPLIISDANHGGIIDEHYIAPDYEDHGPYKPADYTNINSNLGVNYIPSTYINASYYLFNDYIYDPNRHKTSYLTTPPSNGEERRHYLGRFKSLDYLSPRFNNIISGIQVSPWDGGAFDEDLDITKATNLDYYYGNTGADPHVSGLYNLHTDTLTSGGKNERNANGLWFQVYTSIIHGTDGVIFWNFHSWEPTLQDQANHEVLSDNGYKRENFPHVYKSYVAPIAQELKWLSDNNLIGKATKTLYRKTDHPDHHCVIPNVSQYLNGGDIDATRQNENFGIRYTINTNGDDVVMILSNPLPNDVTCTIDLSNLGNEVIQRATQVEFLFNEDIDPTSLTYKANRKNGVSLAAGNILRKKTVTLTNHQLQIDFGKLDVHIIRFVDNTTGINNQINHLEKVWDNDGDGVLGYSKVQPNDTLFIGDFMGSGKEQVLLVQTNPGDAWVSMHDYDATATDWTYLWSNNGNATHPFLTYKENMVVGAFDPNQPNKDLILGFDVTTGAKELFEFDATNYTWNSIWMSDPTDQISSYPYILAVGDFNGAGGEELLAYASPGWTTEFKFNGTDFVWGWWSDYGSGQMNNYRNRYMRSGDFNGDGTDELVGFGNDFIAMDFDVVNFKWDTIWLDPNSLNGWGQPATANDFVLSGDIDVVDTKNELFFAQIGPSAGWATSYDLISTGGVNSWSWNYSANPVTSTDYIRDWPIKETNGTNTEYYLIKAEVGQPDYLLAKRTFGCLSFDMRAKMAMYKTQGAYNYKYNQNYPKFVPTNVDQITPMEFRVYPNPGETKFNIEVEKETVVYTIELYNSIGALVKTVTPEVSSESNTYVIDVSDESITNGVYHIKLNTSRGHISEEVIVLK